MATTITYEHDNELERLLQSDGMEKRVRDIIKRILRKAARNMQQRTRGVIGDDLRQAYKAVRSTVYRRILGGNINILNRRGRAVKMMLIEPPRKLRDGQRGGNRMARSQRTIDIMSYHGADRGFILRFLNSGTADRYDNTRGGYRGSIAPRNFFLSSAQSEMERVMEEICNEIDNEYKKLIHG